MAPTDIYFTHMIALLYFHQAKKTKEEAAQINAQILCAVSSTQYVHVHAQTQHTHTRTHADIEIILHYCVGVGCRKREARN